MRISISTSKVNLGTYQNQISKELRTALAKAGSLAKQIILQRTEKGQGVEGKFEQYTAKHAKRRKKNTLPAIPDLRFTGEMFKAFNVRIKADYAELYFVSAEQNKKAFFNDKIRPFFDLNNKEKERVRKLFRFIK